MTSVVGSDESLPGLAGTQARETVVPSKSSAGVVTLLAVLLVLNGTAIVVRNRYQRRD